MTAQKITGLLLALPIFLLSQETKKLTEAHENPSYKEVYHVLRSDGSTRQGSYQKLGYKDIVKVQGFYKKGLKDSTWTNYYWTGKKQSSGNYLADQKAGVWEAYLYSGELEQKYDYTRHELVYYKPADNEKDHETKVINGADTTQAVLDRPPIYIGGSGAMGGYISENIVYPQDAKEAGVSGKVYIAFTIGSDGKASGHRILRGIGSGCDEEALRVVMQLPDTWLPALLNGKAVSTQFGLPISFSMH